jgi:hypothetical protein
VSTIPLIPNGKVFALVMVTILFTVTAVVVGFAAEQHGRAPAPPPPTPPYTVSVSSVRWAASTSCFTVENASAGPSHLPLGASFAVSTNLTPTDECRGFDVSAVTSASAGFEVLSSTAPVNGTLGEMRELPLSASILVGSSAAQSGALLLDLNVSEVL